METSGKIIVIIAIAAILAAIAVVMGYRRRMRKILLNMDAMLDAAMEGRFRESHFDESLLSAVETKLAHYLSASEVSADNLKEEKDKIKELIGDISHQTKTPIANIMLYSQLLKEQNMGDECEDSVNALNAQAEKLKFLIENLVKTSRLEAGVLTLSPGQNRIADLVRTALKQAGPKAEEKGIEIIWKQGDDSGSALFDLKWTVEALYNLLDNAVKYTPSGGRITITTADYELFSRIDVTDTGMGIPQEEQARVFSRFYRSARVRDQEGVGIGLYLTRQIVSQQGGYVKVTSREGEGAAFSMFLPRTK